MTISQAKQLKPGSEISYNDGRNGHQNVKAVVLSVGEHSLIAQFSDRYTTTKVEFVPEWLEFLCEC